MFALTANTDHIFAPISMPQSAPAPLPAGQSCETRHIGWAPLQNAIIWCKAD